MNDVNILIIDAEIKKNFEKEHKNIDFYNNKLKDINNVLSNKDLPIHTVNTLMKDKSIINEKIDEINNSTLYNFYVSETLELIESYKKILKTPIKINFMSSNNYNNKDKEKIINDYLRIASKYSTIEHNKSPKKRKIVCLSCGNKKDFDIIDGNTYICGKCYVRQIVVKHTSSYNDINRINITSKYMYDPKIHFRDCIKQYQGKQNCTINEQVYKDLEDEFNNHHLLLGDENTPKNIRFSKITKLQIMIFLKELGYSKHYENVNLIHYVLTGIKPNDIGYLEDKLLDDFDKLIALYNKKYDEISSKFNIQRQNFINTQYVLFQLLSRHKYPCNKEQFVILKTTDRKFFHDEICKYLFEELGWNHIPFF